MDTIYIIKDFFFLRNINNYTIFLFLFFNYVMYVGFFFASPSSKNQNVLFLSSKIINKKKKKKTRTNTKASGNYQNACKPLNSKVLIQYRWKK